jgi:preprotein translocase subunit SecD
MPMATRCRSDPYDEKKLLTAPVIQQALGAQFQITGLDSPWSPRNWR